MLETMTGRPEDPHKGSSRQTVMLNLGLGREEESSGSGPPGDSTPVFPGDEERFVMKALP